MVYRLNCCLYSTMADSGRTECDVCGSEEFMLSSGLFFCSECGTQSQDVREELTAKDEAVSFVRTLKMSTKKKVKEEEEDADAPDVTMLEKFQLVLQLQCDALIELGFDPSVKEAVRLLWFNYLQFCGYAFQDPDEQNSSSKRILRGAGIPARVKLVERMDKARKVRMENFRAKNKSSPGPSRKRKRSPDQCNDVDPPTLTPHVTKRKTPNEKVGDRTASPRRKRQKFDKNGKKPVTKNLRFNLDSSDSSENEAETNSSALSVFPDDQHLFELSEHEDSDKGSVDRDSESDEDVTKSGMELYYSLRKHNAAKSEKREYFQLGFTIPFCYLGLLFTQQNFLISDLSKWVRLYKIPYHSLLGHLPRSYYVGGVATSLIVNAQLLPDRILKFARSLYFFMPLPPIPPRDPAPLCHILVDRLHLPEYFHKMVDKTLNNIYRPHFEDCFDFRGGCKNADRFDAKCLAVVVFLVILVYKLDDIHEFEMVRLVDTNTQAEQGEASSSNQSPNSDSVYLWEDWVTMYSRQRLRSLQDALPLNENELCCVTIYTNYLEFCKVELLSKGRPIPLTANRRRSYNPEYYAKLAGIFRQYSAKCKDESTADIIVKQEPKEDILLGESSCPTGSHSGHFPSGEDDFQPPRRIILTALLNDPGAGWKQYDELPVLQRRTGCFGLEISHSFKFLLEISSELIDMQVEDLYVLLVLMESHFITMCSTLSSIDIMMRTGYHMKPAAGVDILSQSVMDSSDESLE